MPGLDEDVLYQKETRLAVENFPFSPFRFPRAFIAAVGLIKAAAAEVNRDLNLLEPALAEAIAASAEEVARGDHDAQFVVDVFQTGSGTSTNMNANEVIATLASRKAGATVHPNDHVNRGQSSNDVIPTAIHISAVSAVEHRLLPAVELLATAIADKAHAVGGNIKTGRTHLMDGVPIRLGQELSGWERQVRMGGERVRAALMEMHALALGGTAVGTGLNTHPEFGKRVAARLAEKTGLPFRTSTNYFAALSSQEPALALSGQLRSLAVAFFKIANDLRWMNSGPVAGLAEIALQPLQAGSSIMPGKVNPVLPEAAAMLCAQVQGNDLAVMLGAQSGSFQLNVMLPLIAWNLLSSIHLLTSAAQALTKAIAGFTVNEARLRELAGRNPILVTALNPKIGYDKAAAIAKEAMRTGRSIIDVAREQTQLTEAELRELLDPERMV